MFGAVAALERVVVAPARVGVATARVVAVQVFAALARVTRSLLSLLRGRLSVIWVTVCCPVTCGSCMLELLRVRDRVFALGVLVMTMLLDECAGALERKDRPTVSTMLSAAPGRDVLVLLC